MHKHMKTIIVLGCRWGVITTTSHPTHHPPNQYNQTISGNSIIGQCQVLFSLVIVNSSLLCITCGLNQYHMRNITDNQIRIQSVTDDSLTQQINEIRNMMNACTSIVVLLLLRTMAVFGAFDKFWSWG